METSVTFTNWMPRRESTSAKLISSLRSAPEGGAGPRGISLGKGKKSAASRGVVDGAAAVKTPEEDRMTGRPAALRRRCYPVQGCPIHVKRAPETQDSAERPHSFFCILPFLFPEIPCYLKKEVRPRRQRLH